MDRGSPEVKKSKSQEAGKTTVKHQFAQIKSSQDNAPPEQAGTDAQAATSIIRPRVAYAVPVPQPPTTPGIGLLPNRQTGDLSQPQNKANFIADQDTSIQQAVHRPVPNRQTGDLSQFQNRANPVLATTTEQETTIQQAAHKPATSSLLNRSHSQVSEFGFGPTAPYQSGIAPALLSQSGIAPLPPHQSGIAPTLLSQSGIAPLPPYQSGIAPAPLSQSGIATLPPYQSGIAPAPLSQSGIASLPPYQSGIAPAPLSSVRLFHHINLVSHLFRHTNLALQLFRHTNLALQLFRHTNLALHLFRHTNLVSHLRLSLSPVLRLFHHPNLALCPQHIRNHFMDRPPGNNPYHRAIRAT